MESGAAEEYSKAVHACRDRYSLSRGARSGFFRGGTSTTARDPYCFLPTIGDLDLYLLGELKHERPYEVLGAHPRELGGVTGVAFAVWAPNARSMSVVGDFNAWDGRIHMMRSIGGSGIWELFVPGLETGARYNSTCGRATTSVCCCYGDLHATVVSGRVRLATEGGAKMAR